MGNNLCKEQYNSPSSLNPVERLLGGCGSMICPNGFGKSSGFDKNYCNRHVYETRPNQTQSQTNTMDSWRNATLTVPNDNKVIESPPVAPPRKNRPSSKQNGNSKTLPIPKNGFKDVFGNAESRRHSLDNVLQTPHDTVDNVVMQKTSPTCFEIDAKSDAFSDFAKIPTSLEIEKPKIRVPKVGNRKSDKFFGENLSDSLSEEPYYMTIEPVKKLETLEKDQIDKFIEKNVIHQGEVKAIDDDAKEINKSLIDYIDDSVGKTTSLDKKAEFLMAMLADYTESKKYGDAKPVVEEIIVPKRRKSRHICDHDDHLHNHLHKNENANKLVTTEVSVEPAPRKPDRDFSKYRTTTDWSDSDDCTAVKRPIRTKTKSISRKDMPSPPARPSNASEPQFQTNLSETVPSTPKHSHEEPQKAHSPRTLKRIISMPATNDNYAPSPRPTLMKSNSSSSFLSRDLRMCQAFENFSPEDQYDGHDDTLVTPTSRLAVRKISTTRRSTESFPSPTVEESHPKFMIGSREVVFDLNQESLFVPECPRIKRLSFGNASDLGSIDETKFEAKLEPDSPTKSESSTIFMDSKEEDPTKTKTRIEEDFGSFIASSRVLDKEGMSHVIDHIYDTNKDILRDFQSYLEEQINLEVRNTDSKNPNSKKLLRKVSPVDSDDEDRLENVRIDLVGSENSNNSTDIDDCFDSEFEKIERIEPTPKTIITLKPEDSDNWFVPRAIKLEVEETQKENNEESDDELGDIPHPHPKPKFRTGRRESIEDVDNWFTKMNATPSEEIHGARKGRRGSDGLVVYDTTRQYPFSAVKRSRNDSHSSDFFISLVDDSIVKKDDSTRRGSDGQIVYDATKNSTTFILHDIPTKDEEPEKDHSTLLKFLSSENLLK